MEVLGEIFLAYWRLRLFKGLSATFSMGWSESADTFKEISFGVDRTLQARLLHLLGTTRPHPTLFNEKNTPTTLSD
ncbi:hypothetical protein Scep_027947 [Stephania cephalantha]|uniref:Uncharacterized protein n=1 Tax=Stephania cephalantha TaxID=152367 RepID=A0AAP0EB76_9MAGN